jgi:hypothetical protein
MHDAENERGGVTRKWLGFPGRKADAFGQPCCSLTTTDFDLTAPGMADFFGTFLVRRTIAK